MKWRSWATRTILPALGGFMLRRYRVWGILSLAALLAACSGTTEKAAPAVTAAGLLPTWTKDQKIELGRQHKTAEDLYNSLRDQAKGGQKLAANALPDWSGIYSRPATN